MRELADISASWSRRFRGEGGFPTASLADHAPQSSRPAGGARRRAGGAAASAVAKDPNHFRGPVPSLKVAREEDTRSDGL